MDNIPHYNEIVEKIVNDMKTNNLHQLPCFINTMGFVEGNTFRSKLLINKNIFSNICFKLRSWSQNLI